ncbi:MAG: membrane protein insertion efficiency factor YidD [Myxococcaceae bacterium]|jgi:putative membrane protein insertion efficiency factor|nr:membrane protein insertion efficiency factor YidD [Myxococcaceae bacterium]MCA3012632.1 membrane protein insertion efficiency factor YidD [Myxococcaceae bacterium]
MSTALAGPRRAAPGLVATLLLVPLRLYKAVLSPLLPPLCRFHPSCSVYAMGAITVHGPLRGVLLTARRLSRCHPFHPGGIDPVPPRDGVDAASLVSSVDPQLARRLAANLPDAAPHRES